MINSLLGCYKTNIDCFHLGINSGVVVLTIALEAVNICIPSNCIHRSANQVGIVVSVATKDIAYIQGARGGRTLDVTHEKDQREREAA